MQNAFLKQNIFAHFGPDDRMFQTAQHTVNMSIQYWHNNFATLLTSLDCAKNGSEMASLGKSHKRPSIFVESQKRNGVKLTVKDGRMPGQVRFLCTRIEEPRDSRKAKQHKQQTTYSI